MNIKLNTIRESFSFVFSSVSPRFKPIVYVISGLAVGILIYQCYLYASRCCHQWKLRKLTVSRKEGEDLKNEEKPANVQKEKEKDENFILMNKSEPTSEPTNVQKEELWEIKAIDHNFTANNLIEDQRNAHNVAKRYLQKEATKINAEVIFVSPVNTHPCPKVGEVKIKHDLDTAVFTWENSTGVQGDIQKDGKLAGHVVLYGVASQFNACEASRRLTPKPGAAVQAYKYDNTQGPAAQLQFPDQQVEIINHAANLGFNGLCQVLNDGTRLAVDHGYLCPTTETSAELLINQLQQNGDKMEFLCIGNIPKGKAILKKCMRCWLQLPHLGITP